VNPRQQQVDRHHSTPDKRYLIHLTSSYSN